MQVKDKYFEGRDLAPEAEVGIEIEMEGTGFPDQITWAKAVPDWVMHHDGSLRGESAEIVLNGPCSRAEVAGKLRTAQKALDAAGVKLQPSVRTGVHVHVNIRDLTEEQVFVFMFCWFLFEQPLVRYCGEDRVGNLFCLRGSDAEAYMDALEEAIRRTDFHILYTDELRYSAMNPKALCEYGSLEFRCLKTPEKLADIEEWVNLLLKVKDYSLTIEDPRDMLEMISLTGGEQIAEDCFQELLPKLPAHDWTMEMFEGLRLIQPSIFARDWNNPKNDDVLLHTELPLDLNEAKRRGALTAREVVHYNL